MNKKNIRATWIELIGFDNRQSDMGVAYLLDKFGFKPDVLVLLVWSSDFVHSYSPDAPDDTLLGWDCSAYGFRRQGLEHEIQQWTKGQVKTLLAKLKEHGIEIYLSFFDQLPREGQIKRFKIPELPKLWVDEHREILFISEKGEIEPNICPWKRLADGSYYEDFLLAKLIPCLQEYGFAGFHGADGYAHQRLTISRGDFSDDMVEQAAIPCEQHCDGHPEKAIPHLVQAIVNNKENLEAQIQLAIAHELVDEADLSLMIYNKIIETNPEFLKAYYNKGAMLMGLGDFEEASKTFFKLIKRNPDYYKAYLGIAMSMDKLGRYSDAIRYYKKFLGLKKFSEDSVFARERIKELKEYLPIKTNTLKVVQ